VRLTELTPPLAIILKCKIMLLSAYYIYNTKKCRK